MTKSDIIIAPAQETDLEQIQKIYEYFVLNSEATLEETPPDLKEITRRWQNIKDKNLPFVVAKTNDEIIGYAYATPYRPRSGYRFVLESSVYVKAGFERKKIGQNTMDHVIKDLRQRDYTQLLAVISGSDNIASIKLHEELGFIERGTLKDFGYKFDKWLDTVLMQLTL